MRGGPRPGRAAGLPRLDRLGRGVSSDGLAPLIAAAAVPKEEKKEGSPSSEEGLASGLIGASRTAPGTHAPGGLPSSLRRPDDRPKQKRIGAPAAPAAAIGTIGSAFQTVESPPAEDPSASTDGGVSDAGGSIAAAPLDDFDPLSLTTSDLLALANGDLKDCRGRTAIVTLNHIQQCLKLV